jgi:hypothetical protein
MGSAVATAASSDFRAPDQVKTGSNCLDHDDVTLAKLLHSNSRARLQPN